MIIDSHQHFWKLERGDYAWPTPDLDILYKNFEPSDLIPLLKSAKVDGTILVQANDTLAETDYLLQLADQHDWILGVVGWVDLLSPDATQQIETFAKHKKFVGLRPMLQGLNNDCWILQAELEPTIHCMIDHGLKFDALVLPKHLTSLTVFARTYPQLKITIDHCAKPDIKNAEFGEWATLIYDIAQLENVYCKLSGLVTEATHDWVAADIIPYAEHILKAFTPRKIMFGSDWPVVNLASNYNDWFQLCQNICKGLNEKQRADIFANNAADFYLS